MEDTNGITDETSPPNANEKQIRLYANTADVEATAYDLAIKFGTFSDGEKSIEAVVRMSPQHAQSLVILLERFLKLYKTEIGDFALPEKLVESLRGENQ